MFPALMANAQKEGKEHQLWSDYFITYHKSSKWSFGGDLGVRGFISNYNWNQYYIRPAITFKPKYGLTITGGVAYFHTNNKSAPNLNEWRGHEQVKFKWPDFGVIELFYRLRLEQRFYKYSYDLPNEYDNRLRLLIGLETMDFNWLGTKSPLYFSGTIEGFKPLEEENSSETFINQFRLDFAFVHRISKSFRYEVHYIAQQSKLFQRDGSEAQQNILRIRFIHNIFDLEE